MKTRQLIRVNAKLTGNVKLVIGNDDNIYIESFDVADFNNKIFKNFGVNPGSSYQKDLKTFLTGKITVPSNILYSEHKEFDDTKIYNNVEDQYETFYNCGCSINRDPYYKERYKILSSLWIGETIPENFIVFKIPDTLIFEGSRQYKNPDLLSKGRIYMVFAKENTGYVEYDSVVYRDGDRFTGSDTTTYITSGIINLIDVTDPDINNSFLKEFISPSEIVKVFDLRESSKFGKYIRNLTTDVNYKGDDIFVDYKNKVVHYYGIDIDSGYITTKKEDISNFVDNDNLLSDFDEFLTSGFERHRLINMHNLNIEYLFDDNDNSEGFSRYYGLYMNTDEICSFTPVVVSPNEIKIRNKIQHGDVVTIDENKRISGVVPTLIKNYYSSAQTRNIDIVTTIKNLYFSAYGAFSRSFDESFDIGANVKVGTVIDNTYFPIPIFFGVATHTNPNGHTVRFYFKYHGTVPVLVTGPVIHTSDVAGFDYYADITTSGILPHFSAPMVVVDVFNMCVESILLVNSLDSRNDHLDGMTEFSLVFIDQSTTTVVTNMGFYIVDTLARMAVTIPTYDITKDHKTTASYFFLEANGVKSKINNIKSDQDIIEEDWFKFHHVETSVDYNLIQPFANLTTAVITTVQIGSFAPYNFSFFGPICIKNLYDILNNIHVGSQPILIKLGETINVVIDAVVYNFIIEPKTQYQTKFILNKPNFTDFDLLNFKKTNINGLVPKIAGRSVIEHIITDEFENGDHISFNCGDKCVVRVFADELDSSHIGTNIDWYFYPYGDTTLIAKSIAAALNNEFENNDVSFRAYHHNNLLFIVNNNYGEYGNSYNIECTSQKSGFNRKYLVGGTNTEINRVIINDFIDIENSYVATGITYAKVISINRLIDEINSNSDAISDKYVLTLHGNHEVFLYEGLISVLQQSPIKLEIGNIIPISDFDTDTYSSIYSKSHDIEYNKYYNVKSLEVGQIYIVENSSFDSISPSIKHNGITRFSGDTFTAVDKSYEVITGNPVIINIKYHDDKELISFQGFGGIHPKSNNPGLPGLISDKISSFKSYLNTEYDVFEENNIPEKLGMKLLSNTCKFVLTDSLDARNNPYRINLSTGFMDSNFSPSFQDYDANPKYFTHEFYYLSNHPGNLDIFDYIDESSYFSSKFDKALLTSEEFDYFSQYFNYRYSILDNDFSTIGILPNQERFSRIKTIGTDTGRFISSTFFRGIRIKFDTTDNIDDWKFSCILNLKTTEILNDESPVVFENIVNEKYRSITLVVTVSVDDYKMISTALDGTMMMSGEYLYLYIMNSVRNHDGVSNTFNDGIIVNFPNIPNVNLVDINDNVITSMFATKLYVTTKSFGPHTIGFSQDQLLDKQYKLKNGANPRIFMLGEDGTLISTQRNGYITNTKYCVQKPTTVVRATENTLITEPNGLFIINIPHLSSGVNTDTQNINTIYDVNHLVWLNEQGGDGYMDNTRKEISFGFMSKLQKEKSIFNTDKIKISFIEPDKIQKKNTIEFINQEKQLEGNPSVITKIPSYSLNYNKLPVMYRYGGGGTMLFKDIVDFTYFTCYLNVGSINSSINSDNKMDSYALTTKIVDRYNKGFQDYILHDIEPMNIVGNNIYNGVVMRGNYVFDLLNKKIGELPNKWFHKISGTNILTTTNPQYYKIGESAIEKSTDNIFNSNFDKKYYYFDKASFRVLNGTNSSKLFKNYLNSIMYGIEEQSDYAVWSFILKTKVEFDVSVPINNECHVYTDGTNINFKFNIRETIKHYYRGKISIKLESMLSGFDNTDFVSKFLDNNISPNINITKVGILSKNNTELAYTSAENLSEAIGDKFRNDNTAASKYVDSDIVIFSAVAQKKIFIPYINFGK